MIRGLRKQREFPLKAPHKLSSQIGSLGCSPSHDVNELRDFEEEKSAFE